VADSILGVVFVRALPRINVLSSGHPAPFAAGAFPSSSFHDTVGAIEEPYAGREKGLCPLSTQASFVVVISSASLLRNIIVDNNLVVASELS
jgi:hypothetical protein